MSSTTNGWTRRNILKTSAALSAGVTLGYPRATIAQSAQPIRLLVLASLSGTAAVVGQGATSGVKTAIDRVNAAGGIMGRKVDLVVVDTATDPSKAAVLLQDNLTSNRPAAVIHVGPAAEVFATSAICNREKLPYFHLADAAAFADVSKSRYLFSMNVPVDSTERIMAQQVASFGVKKIAAMYALDGTGENHAINFKPAFDAAKVDVLAIERFKPTDLDLTSQLRTLDTAAPDLIFVDATGAVNGYILQGINKLDIKRPILFGRVSALSPLETLMDASKLPPSYLYIYSSGLRGPGGRGDSPLAKEILPSLLSYTGGKVITSMHLYGWGHDAALIWATAVRNAQSVDAEAVVANLESWADKPPKDVKFITRENFPYSKDARLPAASADAVGFGKYGTLQDGTREAVSKFS